MATVRLSMTVAFAAQVVLLAQVCADDRAPPPAPIAVIVGQHSFVTDVSKDDLREVYLRRQRLWPNGTRAIPINLPPDDPVRQLFTQRVLGRSTDDLVADWKRLKAAGVEFVEDPTDYDTVSIATLKDPEGNLVQLLQQRPTRGPS